MRGNNPDRWHFTVQTNAHGFAYVYAYQTAWDPVTKRSRRVPRSTSVDSTKTAALM